MRRSLRSFAFLLLAILVAVSLAVAAAPIKMEASVRSETSVTMAAMPMAAGKQPCTGCGPRMDMDGVCALSCGPSLVGILAGPVDPAAALQGHRFDLAAATTKGRAPSPAFTPPRTIILV